LDNVFLLGMVNGCHVSGGTVITGTAKGDLQGYTIEWGAEEKDAVIQIKQGTDKTDAKYPFDELADVAALTITVGT
jgi:hypothetical protein